MELVLHPAVRLSLSQLQKEKTHRAAPAPVPPEAEDRVRRVRTHCPYCAYQCGMLVGASGDGRLTIAGDPDFPVNAGALCVKGWTAAETLSHVERLSAPLVRDAAGQLAPASWATAIDRVAEGIRAIQRTHGRDAMAVFGGGSLTNEKAYALGKFARVVLRPANIDYNGRFCMSSAAAAGLRAFGLDRGLPFPV